MKRVLIVVVVLAAGAWFFGPDLMLRKAYGITADRPLGSLEKMDAYLGGEMGLRRSEVTDAQDLDVPAAARMYKYMSRQNEHDYIVLLADEGGTLTGVVSNYVTVELGARSAPVILLSQAHWERVGGDAEPHFVETLRKGERRVSEATFQTEDVQGLWRIDQEGAGQWVRIQLQTR